MPGRGADIHPDTLQVLEMDRLLEWIGEFAASPAAGREIRSCGNSLSTRWVVGELGRVSEMREILEHRGGFHFSLLADAEGSLEKLLDSPDFLLGGELLELAGCLDLCSIIAAFHREESQSFPRLAELMDGIGDFTAELALIKGAVAEDGELKDSASPELKRLRRATAQEERRLRRELDRVEADWRKRGLLGETGLSWREGKPVLPVPSGGMGRVEGLVVDQSQSGRTLFVEPLESLEIRGRINRLQVELKQEQARIFREISETIRRRSGELAICRRNLTTLDCLAAKAAWSVAVKGRAPRVTRKLALRIVQGRHPLLLRNQEVVPLDLSLGQAPGPGSREENAAETSPEGGKSASGPDRILLISGPNAGGKTVAIKTAGLFALMIRAGLHLPCGEGTRLPLFEVVLGDIGDQQSIENDLSTYSSHLLRLNRILEGAGARGLFLVDELGGGTDPEEGSSVAMAFLEQMLTGRGLTLVSTHLGQLKAFAHNSPGIQNASMSFDEERIEPTFRLIQGVPGSSYALEILQRMGLPRVILDRARYHMGGEQKNLARLISRLQSQLARADRSRRNVEAREIELESLTARYRDKVKHARREVRQLKSDAVSEAASIVRGANRLVERTVREIREDQARAEHLRESREQLAGELQNLERRGRKLEPRARPRVIPEVREGDLVSLEGLETPARVIRLDSAERKITVEAGALKLNCELERVTEVLPEEQRVKHAGPGGSRIEVSAEAPRLRLDLRGMSAGEAIGELERYLDQCMIGGLSFVTILHGKGTGALRHAVRDHLRNFPCVKDFRDGLPEEGGDGVTVIRLDV